LNSRIDPEGRSMTRTPLSSSFLGSILALGLVLWFAPASAGDWNGAVTVGIDYQGWTDLDDPNGEFDFIHPSVSGKAAKRLGEDSRWGVALVGEYRAFAYRFDGLAAGDVWDDIHVVRLAPRLIFAVNEKWSLFGGPVGEFSGEGGTEFGDAIRGGALVGAQWRPNDRLSIGLGVLGMNKLADDLLLQPVVIIEWKITDALTFATQSWTSRGGTLEFSYAFDGGWETSIAGGRERERFRLDSNLPAIGEGVGEENSLPITFAVAKNLDNGMRVEIYGGAVLNGELRVEDETGDKVAVSDFDRSWFLGGALTVPF